MQGASRGQVARPRVVPDHAGAEDSTLQSAPDGHDATHLGGPPRLQLP
jgi:hypothetical protein